MLFEVQVLIKTSLYIAIVAATLTCTMLLTPLASGDQNSAQNAINSAKKTLKECYTAVSQAEAAGANVTSLVATLNQAAGKFSMAELAYAGNNFDIASSYANQAQSKLSGLTNEAVALKQAATSAASQDRQFTILSLTFSIALLSAGFAVWLFFNRREKRYSNATSKL